MRAQRKFFKPIMGRGSALDHPAILLHHVVQVLDLPDPDECFPFSIDCLRGGKTCSAFIHGYGLRCAIAIDGIFKVAARSSLRDAPTTGNRPNDRPYPLRNTSTFIDRLCRRKALSNNGTSFITLQCTLKWSTSKQRSAIISSSLQLSE
jgi:hypothetical protein